MTTIIEQRLKSPPVWILGILSGIVCFGFFWTSFQLSVTLAREWGGQAEPAKWIGGLLVILISMLVTHAWDRIRVRYRLDVVQYWTMIGLALSICSLVALLSGGF